MRVEGRSEGRKAEKRWGETGKVKRERVNEEGGRKTE